ncbi:MAG: hypothetical protein OEO19_18545 [Gammaproteobacteria bacterium]|nr:hypothetical protein [Gammaproteobacteria bacterium]MDH3447171.1 hypothetical protein [Gammaproteobacteria bacterium]
MIRAGLAADRHGCARRRHGNLGAMDINPPRRSRQPGQQRVSTTGRGSGDQERACFAEVDLPVAGLLAEDPGILVRHVL